MKLLLHGLLACFAMLATAADRVTVTLRDAKDQRVIAELTAEAKEEGETLARNGTAQDFTTGWEIADDGKPKPGEQTRHFIGTELRINRRGADKPWEIQFRHDLRAPDTHLINHAMTATGAQRDAQSVAAPRLHRVEWTGSTTPSAQERTLANLTAPDGQKLALSIRGTGGESPAPAQITQTIYRIAEKDLLQWLLREKLDDSALAQRLEANATVISRVQTVLAKDSRSITRIGTRTHVTSEINPDYDRLIHMPVRTEQAFTGTVLDILANPNNPGLQWHSHHMPLPPLKVLWPASWLRIADENTPPGKGTALHGWMDWFDRFEQRFDNEVTLPDNAPHLISIQSPPDQTWPADKAVARRLDVTIAQRSDGTPAAKPPVVDRHMLIGLRLPHAAAFASLAAESLDEEALFNQLMQSPETRVELFSLAAFTGDMFNQSSERVHAYPTEMPSIPSAWNDMHIGTSVQSDGTRLVCTHDLAPPARSEWKLARDNPDIIMWEPRRRYLHLNLEGVDLQQPGTRLVAACSLPPLLQSADFDTKDTVLVFARREKTLQAAAPGAKPVDPLDESPKPPADPFSPPAGPAEKTPTVISTAFVFEIDPQDSFLWHQLNITNFATTATQQLQTKKARLLAQVVQRGLTSELRIAEEYMTATEFDPPEPEAAGRLRPTALETLPVGTHFEMSAPLNDSKDLEPVTVTLRHTTALPVEPSLEDFLKLHDKDELNNHTGAKHDFVEWTEKELHVQQGQLQCLGQKLTPDGKTVIAFIRVQKR